MNDVIIGAWRNGLNKQMAADLEITEKRHAQGFRLLGFEATVLQLAQLLDAHDELFAELLSEDKCCVAPVQIREPFSIDYEEEAKHYTPQYTEPLVEIVAQTPNHKKGKTGK